VLNEVKRIVRERGAFLRYGFLGAITNDALPDGQHILRVMSDLEITPKALRRNNQRALRRMIKQNIRRNTASPIDALQITPYGLV
jgi:hypothetical protein